MDNNPTPEQELDSVIDSYAQQQQTDPQPAAAEPAQDPAPEAEPAQQQQQQQQEPSQQTQQTPANAAFAQMRTQNTQMNNIIKAFAKLEGYDTEDLNALSQALEEKLTAQEAKDAQVPPEFMARFRQQEAMLNAIMQQNAQNNLSSAFEALKVAHGLDDAKLYTFAQELKEQNYNLQDLNKLGVYYKGLHFDELVKEAVDKALADAASTNNYAAQHSASVPTTKGADDDNTSTGDDAADTLAAIMSGMAELNKK